MDLISQAKSEDLLPLKRMGPLVCVSLIEASSRAPARIMACRECSVCVEKIGLSGIGKKGVIAAAKSLSDEKFPDNRNALLDLIELLLSRMSNDMQRFARICGANLSGKARSAIEERLERSGGSGGGSASATPKRSGIPPPTNNRDRRTTPRLPNQARSPVAAVPRPALGHTRATPKIQAKDENDHAYSQSNFGDELPALELRFGGRDHAGHEPFVRRGSGTTGVSISGSDAGSAPNSPRRIFTSHHTVDSSQSIRSISYSGSATEDEAPSSAMGSPRRVESSDAESGVSTDLNGLSMSSLQDSSRLESIDQHGAESSVGAAASLRARLMRIREKNKNTALPAPASTKTSSDIGAPLVDEPSKMPANSDLETQHALDAVDSKRPSDGSSHTDEGAQVYKSAMGKIRTLASRVAPLAENDQDLIACTNALKTIHAAVSNQPKLATGMDAEEVSRLGDLIVENTNETVSCLTR